MQCQDELPIQSETPLNLKTFYARLTRPLVPAGSSGCRQKDFELQVQYGTEVQLRNSSVELLQCSWSGIHRKVGNVALTSPNGIPGEVKELSIFVSHLSGINRPKAEINWLTLDVTNPTFRINLQCGGDELLGSSSYYELGLHAELSASPTLRLLGRRSHGNLDDRNRRYPSYLCPKLRLISPSHRMTTSKPTIDELVRSMHEQVELLTSAAAIEGTGQADLRDEIAHQHLRRAAELVRGAAALGAVKNSACLGILGRCLLEQLITALWAIRSQENAQTHLSAATTELTKALKINLQAGKAKIKNRCTEQDATAEFLDAEQMKNIPKRKSVQVLAKDAGISDLYTVFYRFMSLDTHGHHGTLKDDSDANAQCEMNLQGIGAISRAIGQACVWWLLHRSWPDNEAIRDALGLNRA